MLGLQVATPMGETWTLAPHLSGLSVAEGSFEPPLGTASGSSVTINVSTPSGTNGQVMMPKGNKVSIDGRSVKFTESKIIPLTAGTHIVVASD